MVRLTRNIDTRNAVMTSNVYRCTKFKRDSIAIRNELCEALSRPTQNFICGFAPQKWKVTKETLEIKGQELRSVFFFLQKCYIQLRFKGNLYNDKYSKMVPTHRSTLS